MTWRLPAEWEVQEAVWFVWPRDPLTWPDRVEKARAVFVEACRAVAAHQRVEMAVHPDLLEDARVVLGDIPNVHLWPVLHQDSWIRDYGPLTLVDDAGGRRLLKFGFDAWGGKYESLLFDDGTVERLHESGALPSYETVGFVLEGGAVETDGQGTFLATESVAAGRGQTPAEHEAALRKHLHAAKVLWLDRGIGGDDTDGHIDTLARFVAPAKLVTAVAPRGHPDHDALRENRRRLEGTTDALGRRITVVELPVPPTQTTDDGDPLPAGYANFLITNGVVLVPQYGGPADAEARAVLAACFPDRQVVGLDHRDLIWGFGGIHCLSMQMPSRSQGTR